MHWSEHVYKVEPSILALLEDNRRLLHRDKLVHSYPHCWRTKTPLIFRATPQWFISMQQNGLLAACEKAANNVEWVPDWGKARIEGMLAQSPDWCISRQRTWGVPIALFVHKETSELHPETPRLIEAVAQRVAEQGIASSLAGTCKDNRGGSNISPKRAQCRAYGTRPC